MNHNNEYMHVEINEYAIKQLKKNAGWFMGLGIALIILGTLAVMFAVVSTVISVVYLGFMLMFAGFFEGVKSFKMSRWSNFFLHLFLSVLYVVAGFFIVSNPQVSSLELTLLLAIFFIVSGIMRIVFAFARHVPHKGWLIFNGAITLLLGILVWQQWPQSGLWVIGMFMGIDILFTGWTWIMLSLAAKRLSNNHQG